MTRNEAIKLGSKTYFTGKLCKNGHMCEKWVVNYTCVECGKSINSRSYQKHKEKRLQSCIAYTKAHPQQRKEIIRRYYIRHRERLLSNRDKKADLERLRQWATNNPQLVNANTARRRAQRLKATPSWVDNELLKQIYLDCPKGHEVDHQLPLRHPLICGLHVPWNLEYLTAQNNRLKGNKFESYEERF